MALRLSAGVAVALRRQHHSAEIAPVVHFPLLGRELDDPRLAKHRRTMTAVVEPALETIGRNNPLGAMAAAMMVGVLIGLIGRGRI